MITNKIKTLFLSAQPYFLTALLNLFASDPLITAFAFDFNTADKFNRSRKFYDIVVLDDTFLKESEIKNSIHILLNNVEAKKILFTDSNELTYLQYFICLGFNGIISKQTDSNELRNAIINVFEKEYYLDTYIKNILHGKNLITNHNILSSREKEIMKMIKEGFKNKEISEKLFISVKTVESHKENIKHKLEIKRINELYSI